MPKELDYNAVCRCKCTGVALAVSRCVHDSCSRASSRSLRQCRKRVFGEALSRKAVSWDDTRCGTQQQGRAQASTKDTCKSLTRLQGDGNNTSDYLHCSEDAAPCATRQLQQRPPTAYMLGCLMQHFVVIPCDVFSSVSILAQSVMSVAVVAILAMSAPCFHI